MSRDSVQYRTLLQTLLPKGKLWPKNNNTILSRILYGLAEELARIENRVTVLFDEKDVRSSDELLEEHELDYGLPDEKDIISPFDNIRRQELHSMLMKIGQQFKQYFIDIASALGYTITIEQFTPLWRDVGAASDKCGDCDIIFYWLINIHISSIDNCAEVNIKKLINKLSYVKPAHTHILFDFYGKGFSRGFSNGFESFPVWDNSWEELAFDRGFDDGFANAYDYDGINFVGAFNKGFSIDFDRYSGGGFDGGFADNTNYDVVNIGACDYGFDIGFEALGRFYYGFSKPL